MFKVLKRPNFWVVFLGDAVFVALSLYLAYLLRFDGSIPPSQFKAFIRILPWVIPIKLAGFFFFGLYKGMWRYTGIYDLENLVKACVISSGIIVFILVLWVRFEGYPRSIFAIDLVLTFLFLSGTRVGIRLLLSSRGERYRLPFMGKKDEDRTRILIVGAGDAGEKLIREIRENEELRYDVAGFLDDNERKRNQTIHGVPVLGSVEEVQTIADKEAIDEIIIAISAASAGEMRRVVGLCEATGIPCKTIPGVGELIEGRVSVRSIRKVRYEDLLGRRQARLNLKQIGGYLTDKRVMVTGGCGSIGSELCRQIIRFRPKTLMIVDINESGLFDIEMEFTAKFPDMKVAPVLCPIQDRHVMGRVFKEEKPEVVFHAAAYKHVPMLELHPWEAVLNNIVGTQAILELCSLNGVRRCVVVSTDKAVRPTNVMGASKRVGELLARCYARETGARNMCVRFGNVVYSVGSVVPLFRKQIERGGPITLTHPDVMRYFMTIPEASQLILQAGAIGNGGEIFILKMGTPIRIADMARDLIRLSGFEPDTEIEIKEIGLRPGEKLIEELITEGEGICETEHEEIMVLKADPQITQISQNGKIENALTLKRMRKHIKRLVNYAEAGDGEKIRAELKRVVPEYHQQS
ncbi:MAG: nucleoside-diphosphate sugar epimerase/dehydratase [Deltaproteobacteria bacterium]|nr:nucleoside-diphosphate sugar epimerase/dehydratase [Deltaproteobacteria bacterium]